MRNEDNDCIRYLMREMDPSEELLMERAMMEDENLLIEVESMRQTFKKLDQLPQVDPPSDVCNSILQKASEHAEKKRNANFFKPVYKYAVAATLALTITAGGMWFYIGEGTNQGSSSTELSQGAVNFESDMFFLNDIVQKASTNDSEIEPWVDRNNVLHYEAGKEDSNFKAILQNSTQKLQLIDHPVNRRQRPGNIQLTGSGN